MALVAAQDRAKRQPGHQPAAVTTAAPTATAMETTTAAPPAVAAAMIAASAAIATTTTVPPTAMATAALMTTTAVAAAPILRKHGCRRNGRANQGKRSYRGRQNLQRHRCLLRVVTATRRTLV
ncbi:MAG: hypothetical protein WA840_14320 [Caulobacteraceae bacterium]